MPETQVVDEIVERSVSRAPNARPVLEENVESRTGAAKAVKGGAEEDSVREGGRKGRAFKESTEKLLQELDKRPEPAPHEVGDEDEADEDAGSDDTDAADEGDEDEGGEEGEGEEADEDAEGDESGTQQAEWQTKYATLEERNKSLISELETARKTPKAQRTERETQLLAAESSYIDEGSIPALRKFLGVIVGAAPDSKEVDAELAGLYTDLTARELGVTLDQNQQALRDNARTRLLLARDKREKAEADKKPAVDNSADDAQYGDATKYLDNLLAAKGQSGSSIADEYPMLMSLAQDFDGYAPGEVLARAIRREIMVGTLDPNTSDVDMIRAVAPKIERHYDAVAKKIEATRAKKTKPNTTTPSEKPKVATDKSKEQRQSQGARTISNATASRAPAKLPKTTKQKADTTAEKTRKDFKSDAEWRAHLLTKHFSS